MIELAVVVIVARMRIALRSLVWCMASLPLHKLRMDGASKQRYQKQYGRSYRTEVPVLE